VSAVLAAALSFTGVTAPFLIFAAVTAPSLICFTPTLFLGRLVAAQAVPPPSSRRRQRVEMTFE
jgi:hypothetical protein